MLDIFATLDARFWISYISLGIITAQFTGLVWYAILTDR